MWLLVSCVDGTSLQPSHLDHPGRWQRNMERLSSPSFPTSLQSPPRRLSSPSSPSHGSPGLLWEGWGAGGSPAYVMEYPHVNNHSQLSYAIALQVMHDFCHFFSRWKVLGRICLCTKYEKCSALMKEVCLFFRHPFLLASNIFSTCCNAARSNQHK